MSSRTNNLSALLLNAEPTLAESLVTARHYCAVFADGHGNPVWALRAAGVYRIHANGSSFEVDSLECAILSLVSFLFK